MGKPLPAGGNASILYSQLLLYTFSWIESRLRFEIVNFESEQIKIDIVECEL